MSLLQALWKLAWSLAHSLLLLCLLLWLLLRRHTKDVPVALRGKLLATGALSHFISLLWERALTLVGASSSERTKSPVRVEAATRIKAGTPSHSVLLERIHQALIEPHRLLKELILELQRDSSYTFQARRVVQQALQAMFKEQDPDAILDTPMHRNTVLLLHNLVVQSAVSTFLLQSPRDVGLSVLCRQFVSALSTIFENVDGVYIDLASSEDAVDRLAHFTQRAYNLKPRGSAVNGVVDRKLVVIVDGFDQLWTRAKDQNRRMQVLEFLVNIADRKGNFIFIALANTAHVEKLIDGRSSVDVVKSLLASDFPLIRTSPDLNRSKFVCGHVVCEPTPVSLQFGEAIIQWIQNKHFQGKHCQDKLSKKRISEIVFRAGCSVDLLCQETLKQGAASPIHHERTTLKSLSPMQQRVYDAAMSIMLTANPHIDRGKILLSKDKKHIRFVPCTAEAVRDTLMNVHSTQPDLNPAPNGITNSYEVSFTKLEVEVVLESLVDKERLVMVEQFIYPFTVNDLVDFSGDLKQSATKKMCVNSLKFGGGES